MRNLRTSTVKKAVPEPIRTQFNSGGFSYRQIVREGHIAIYEQRWRNSDNVAYEVVRLRVRTHPFKNDGQPYEAYPGSEAWGTYGWTYTDKDAPFAKLRELSLSPDSTGKNKSGTVGDILEPETETKPKLKPNEIIPKLR